MLNKYLSNMMNAILMIKKYIYDICRMLYTDSISDVLMTSLSNSIPEFNITRVKMIYDRHGQSEIYASHCHLMIDGLHQHFRYSSIVQV